ncbi:hypothetical protein Tco_1205214 [Tanacetum coccineum]
MDNLQLLREEDGTSEIVDPQDCLGSLELEVLDSTILTLLLEPTDLVAWSLLIPQIDSNLAFNTKCLTSTLLTGSETEFILFKLDLTFLEWSSTLFFLLLLGGRVIPLFFVLPEGFDPLALVVGFTLVEVNKGLLESLVLKESVGLGILTTTNFSLGFGELGHV